MKNNIVPVVLSVSSATLLTFSFHPFNLSFLAWIALVPLFCIPQKISPKKIFILYYSAGIIFWLSHIWWLIYVTPLGYVLLSFYLALFFGLLGLLIKFSREKTGYPLLFLAPPIWVMLEFARTYMLISFPWSLLGYSQWHNTALIQISSITGVYGVSFLIVMFNAAASDLVLLKTKKHFRNLLLSFLTIINVIVWGWHAIPLEQEGYACQKIKISVIQGNIPQNIKWDEEYSKEIINTYAELSIYAGTDHDVSLIVWPETSYPDYISVESELFQKVRNLTYYLDTHLLFGAVTSQNNRDYNSALLLLSPEAEIEQVYNKLRLVQFAEYLPLKKLLFFLSDIFPQIGDFSKGTEYTIFNIKNQISNIKYNFATLICFEDLFPDLARDFTNNGAQFLVNITNDAHFKESPALWQHFAHSIFRAVENRRPIVRAANNGISAFINSYGKPIEILTDANGKARGARGYATAQISPSNTKTFYTRFGDLFIYINLLYLFALSIYPIRQQRKKGKQGVKKL